MWDDVLELRRTRRQDDCWVKVRNYNLQIAEQLVGEDVLRNGDEERATESLREHDDGGTDGDVCLWEHRLDGNEGLLHAEADTKTEHGLVADPLRVTGVRSEGGEQACANGHEDGGSDDERRVVAELGDGSTCNHRDDDETENERQVVDAGFGCCRALDGLEPDWEVVDHDEEGTACSHVSSRTQNVDLLGDIPRVAPNQAEAATLRCLRTRGGTVALSCFFHWTNTKIRARTPKTTNSAMMRPLLHGYLLPPHCSARRRQTIMGRKKTVPRRSNCSRRAFQPTDKALAFFVGWKKKMMNAPVTPPNGRLM